MKKDRLFWHRLGTFLYWMMALPFVATLIHFEPLLGAIVAFPMCIWLGMVWRRLPDVMVPEEEQDNE